MFFLSKYNVSVHPLIVDNNQNLIRNRDLIEDFVQKNLPFMKHIHLARVSLKEDTIEYFTDIPGNFKTLEDFTVFEKNRILNHYNKARYLIEDFFNHYHDQQSASIQQWRSIFDKVFHPANNLIFAQGDDIVLLWGCNFFNEQENLLPRSAVIFDEEESETEQEETAPEGALDPADVLIDPANSEPIEIQKNILEDHQPSLHEVNSEVEKRHEIYVRSNKSNTRNLFNRFFSGLGDLFLRGWWFILLLLILFFWFNNQFCSSCDGVLPISNEEKENAQIYLPPQEGIAIPIDSVDIGYDADSLFLIANDRINVALKNKQDDFYGFINRLGESFLNENREIIYYDEETTRIQILFDGATDTNIKDELRKALPDFELLIWDESIFVSSFQGFNDPFLEQAQIRWYLDLIKMNKAWEITTGVKDVIVAVVDDGFDLTHPELRNTTISQKYNVVEKRNHVYGNTVLSHGTHVSTILLGAANNNNGLLGIAPDVSFMPIQIGSQSRAYFSNTDIIDGILYALKNKASVINLSLGKQFSPEMENLSEAEQKELINNFGKDEEEFWKELFRIAEDQNTTIVIAAGNSGILSGIDPMQRYENTIIVGAVDRRMKFAEFSNYGDFNTIQAPGVQIVSAIPGNTYAPMDGTSMAAPIVSGAVALYKSIYPDATNKEIKEKLINSAQHLKVINVESFLK
jgi:subtilisin family serine protease